MSSSITTDVYYTVPEAMKYLGVTRNNLMKLIGSKQLATITLYRPERNRLMVSEQSMNEYKKGNQ